MASDECVERVLKAIAAMYGKHPLWIKDMRAMWSLQLENLTDEQVYIGTKDLVRKSKKLPSVAQLLEVIEANPKSAPKPVVIPGCAACRNTGMREVARWYFDSNEALRVFVGVAACDCNKGARLSIGAFQDYRDVQEAWKRQTSTTQVYCATAAAPLLTDEQKYTAQERARRAELREKYAEKYPRDKQTNIAVRPMSDKK